MLRGLQPFSCTVSDDQSDRTIVEGEDVKKVPPELRLVPGGFVLGIDFETVKDVGCREQEGALQRVRDPLLLRQKGIAFVFGLAPGRDIVLDADKVGDPPAASCTGEIARWFQNGVPSLR
jgi:hypothetical protein